MGLTEWAVGLVTFQILIVVFLVGIGAEFKQSAIDAGDADLISESIRNQTTEDFNALTAIGDFVGILENFYFAVSGLPLWANILTAMPILILTIIIFMYARGVS